VCILKKFYFFVFNDNDILMKILNFFWTILLQCDPFNACFLWIVMHNIQLMFIIGREQNQRVRSIPSRLAFLQTRLTFDVLILCVHKQWIQDQSWKKRIAKGVLYNRESHAAIIFCPKKGSGFIKSGVALIYSHPSPSKLTRVERSR
jgi:hypothetical protein